VYRGDKRLPQAVHFSLDEESATKFAEFMQREGYTSVSAAARTLVLAGLDQWPQLGVNRATRLAVVFETRKKIIEETAYLFRRLERELLEETNAEREAQAHSDVSNAVVNLEIERGLR
jgi:hypothetical protein